MTKTIATGVEPADFFVLRAPLLPHATLTAWSAGLLAPGASDSDLEQALADDRAVLLARLRAEVDEPAFREALFCASPSLDAALQGWLADPTSAASASVTPILVRYLARMSARATPFGLFSSCGVGRVGPGSTSLSIAEAPVVRHTRLDMQYLTDLVQRLEKDPEIRAVLRFWPSTGLYRIGDQLHHAEAEMRGEPKARAYRLVSLDAGESLEVALARAREGALPAEVVSAVLAGAPDVDADSARAFVDDLIDSQVLVSELSPPITGPEPIHHVIAVLRARAGDVPLGASAASALEQVRDRLDAIDRGGVGQGAEAYRQIAEQLRALPAPVELSRLFQIDLIRSAEASRLGDEVLAEVQRGIALLRRIAVPSAGGDLAAFAKAFHERYEGREVPLHEALDDETGIGFGQNSTVPTDLLEGLPFPSSGGAPQVPWGPREAWLMRRVLELARSGERTWKLDERDLAALETKLDVAVPDSLYVTLTIAAPSAAGLAGGEFQIAMSGVAPGGAIILGRFCHADPRIDEGVRSLVENEEALCPDTIFAEIVHQPEGRMGNILCRPVLRAHEIPYLARSGVEPDHQIPIDDLLVSIGSTDAEPGHHLAQVRLRSKRLGRWVQPRMSNAHNPQTVSLGVYRFLCAMRSGSPAAYPVWSWGPLEDAPHLPRVTSGRLVLALEQWTLNKADLEPFKKVSGVARHRALRALRDRFALPRWVALVDGDHVLPVDLDNVLSADSFVDLIKQRTRAVLNEVFPAEGGAPVEGPAGRHVSEVVLPLFAKRAPSRARPVVAVPVIRRAFGAGSAWLYAKVYSGHATTDAVLREIVASVLRSARGSGAVHEWFFIRYADPHPHLRVRFRGDPARLAAEVLPSLHGALEPWLASGRIHRLDLDTYVREVERYGGDAGMELSETLFGHDSDAVLQIVESFDGSSDAEVRWRLALVGLDRLLGDLGFDQPAKLALLRVIRAGFAAEHAVDTRFERELGARFRAVRGEVEGLLGVGAVANATVGAATALPGLAAGLELFARRSERSAEAMAELRARSARGELSTSLSDLAASYLHMHANRMLAADHRAQELVLYDFLLRVYESTAARARRAST